MLFAMARATVGTTRFPPMDLEAMHNLVSCVLDEDMMRTDPGTVHLLFTLAVALAMADFEDAHMRTRVMGATQVLHEGHITAEKFLEHLHARLAQKLPPRKPTSYSQSPGSYGRITR